MARERFYDERDYEDGAVPDDGFFYEECDPDLSIPSKELTTLEDELYPLGAVPEKSSWQWSLY